MTRAMSEADSTPPVDPSALRPTDRAELPPMRRLWLNVKDIIRFGKPHWKPFVGAFLLMTVMSFSSLGRIVLLLPIIERIGFSEAPAEGEEGVTGEATATAMEHLKKQSDRSLSKGVDDVVNGLNSMTRHWVPDMWLEDIAPNAPPAERERLQEVDRDKYATLWSILLLFAVVTAIMCFSSFWELYLAQLVQLRIGMDVRENVCRSLLDQPIAFFDSRQRGDILQRALGDTAGFSAGLNMLLGTTRTILQVGSSMILLVAISPLMALVTLIGLPFLLPMKKLGMRTLKRSHRRQKKTVALVENLLQIFSGVRTVKAFGTEEQRVKEFRESDEAVTEKALKVQRAKSTSVAMVAFLNNVLAVALVCGGGWFIMQGHLAISVPELITFMLILVNMYQPIKRTVRQSNDLLDSMASIERTMEVMNLPPGNPDVPNAVTYEGVKDAIRFEHIDFAYVEDTPVLRDVSFEIPRGATVALVGPSGSGKSTLCDLLLRFYNPDEGRIAIDGTDLRTFKRTSYLEHTAVVTQEPFLFHTSIKENIRQGRPDATDEQIIEAAKAAHIHDHIEALPHGYDEVVGEQGAKLSGGQRQRITIARALVRDPDVLVLDEATSSLDTASEKAVQDALENLRAGRTTLVVAHRLSTIRSADLILVLNEGQVVERGTHDELVALSGLYAELVRLQDVSARS